MTRDEVLERLDRMEDQAKYQTELMEGSGQWAIAASHRVDAELFYTAAELIRQSGWREITEAPEGQSLIVGGYWRNGKADEATRPYVWIREGFQMEKDESIEEKFTHYLPEPEPPAREDSKAKNGE